MGFKIFLSPPNMCGKELEYVKECFDTNWIAPYGPQLDAFEKEMASYISVDKALAVTSGTAAIHLALRWYDVKPGDIIFCSDFTFIGSGLLRALRLWPDIEFIDDRERCLFKVIIKRKV